MRIVLVQPPVWGVYEPPAAIAQLSACLKKAGHAARAYDLNIRLYNARTEAFQNIWAIERSSFWCDPANVADYFDKNGAVIAKYVDEILAATPAMVCFSINVASLHATKMLAGMIKKRAPQTVIVGGGPLFLVPFTPADVLSGGLIDIIIAGEGEAALVELADLLENKKDISACPGILYQDTAGLHRNPPRPLDPNLDELPFLDFSDMPFSDYDPPGHLGHHISIMASRGCVQQCAFCGPRAYWPGYRFMSGRRIYDEICFHVKNHPETMHIEFLDLLVNGNMKALVDFCELMNQTPPKSGLKWHANLIIRKEMTREVFEKMRGAGCAHVTFGIESGSQRVLDSMRKHYRITDADNVLKAAHEAGVGVTCNFMFGFPGETREDFEQTLDFLRRNKDNITIAYPSRTFFTIEPYSYIADHLDEFGMVPDPHHGQYWQSKDGLNTYPERMRRCEEFSLLAVKLNVNVGLGLQTSLELDRWLNLGAYHEARRDYPQAVECYRRYLALDPANESIASLAERLTQQR